MRGRKSLGREEPIEKEPVLPTFLSSHKVMVASIWDFLSGNLERAASL